MFHWFVQITTTGEQVSYTYHYITELLIKILCYHKKINLNISTEFKIGTWMKMGTENIISNHFIKTLKCFNEKVHRGKDQLKIFS